MQSCSVGRRRGNPGLLMAPSIDDTISPVHLLTSTADQEKLTPDPEMDQSDVKVTVAVLDGGKISFLKHTAGCGELGLPGY